MSLNQNEITSGFCILLQNKKADQNLLGVSVRKEAVELTGQEVMKELGLKSLRFSAHIPFKHHSEMCAAV